MKNDTQQILYLFAYLIDKLAT